MAIIAINTSTTGLVGVYPRIVYINTTDTVATVTTAGYLNQEQANGASFRDGDAAVVITRTTPSNPLVSTAMYQVNFVAPNWSLTPMSGSGEVTLPTIANHIATYTNMTGGLTEDPATAISGGNIQAGLTTGTAGVLYSCPGTTTTGRLGLASLSSAGAYDILIRNASHGQASTYSIPDCGTTAANIIISKLTGTQHITVGALQVDAGIISSGISTGGTAGGFISYPATTTNGSLRLTPVGNVGNFNTVISDVTGLAQSSTYTLPDPANATARILVGATATPFTTAHLLASSGTGGLVADSGIATSAVQLSANIKAQQVASLGGGGAGPLTVTAAGATTSSVIVVSIVASSNTVSVSKVTPGTGNFALLLSGDPGATLTISYVMFIAAQ